MVICRNCSWRLDLSKLSITFSTANVMRSDTQKNIHTHRGCATNALYMNHCGTQCESNLWYQYLFLFAQYFQVIYKVVVPALRSMITISSHGYGLVGSNGRMMCLLPNFSKIRYLYSQNTYGSSGLLRNVGNHLPGYTKLRWKMFSPLISNQSKRYSL